MYHKTLRRLFTHPSSAIELLRQFTKYKRWACPRCGVIHRPEIHHTDQRGVKTYRCNHCHRTFSELYGTIFYRSKVPLDIWCKAIIYWITSTGSISAAELERKVGISYPSAWKLLMKIRKELDKSIDMEQLKEEVEGDEGWFGKKRNDNQDIIMGLVERTRRKLRFFEIENLKEETLYPIIRENVQKGSKFYTDQRNTYAITGLYYEHHTTNHSKGEFARKGSIHSNTIEQIWGDVKGIIRTIHHGISKKYRRYYLSQYIFKYENIHQYNLFNLTLFKIFSPTYCLY
jgi:transposase-like protein